ncbi:MAG: sigma-70 family RNA polymerase sigma factor [Candidatus Brocadiaceae bacterium]|nr:sigma-70 family RNA polymerase sigma factor [Candidatus Brocadiaceae bacterium]
MNLLEEKITYAKNESHEDYIPEENIEEWSSFEEERENTDHNPLRLYLKEMATLPLLSRDEEVYLAKKLRVLNQLLHRKILGFDYALDLYTRTLEEVTSESELIQFVETSFKKDQSRGKIIEQISNIAKKIRALLDKNAEDYESIRKSSTSKDTKIRLLRKTLSRNRMAIRELESASMCSEKIFPIMRQLLDVLSEIMMYKELPSGSVDKKALNKKFLHGTYNSNEIKILLLSSVEKIEKKIDTINAIYKAYESTRKRFSEGNLRLVVSIAKRYRKRGLAFHDLIQEGNTGLMRAIDKYDYRMGYKFSTYATWWIKQAIIRATEDKSRTVRIPVHMVDVIKKASYALKFAQMGLEEEARLEDVVKDTKVSAAEISRLFRVASQPISLASPVGNEGEAMFEDFIQDKKTESAVAATQQTLLREQLQKILDTLSHRESEVIKLRFGIGDGDTYSLEEIGKRFNITRERIRQIESLALRKLQHPVRSRKLEGFLDDVTTN